MGGAGVAAAASFNVSTAVARNPAALKKKSKAHELRADIVIIGGGLGGCAAALSAAARGRKVILTEETDWIGGQSTAQAVPPDENKWIETTGANALYQDYRRRVREYYKRNYPLTDEARKRDDLNPGNGNVSKLCHEPRVSHAALNEMLAPYLANGTITLLLRHAIRAADVHGDRVAAVRVQNLETGHDLALEGDFFIDATELGALLPLAGIEHVTGAESRADTGELHAGEKARPGNMQAFTFCFAMEYLEGEDHTIEKPTDYGFWRDYVPNLTPPWPGRLLAWPTTHPVTLKERVMPFDPTGNSDSGWWKYRRILDRRNFADGFLRGDTTLVNWPHNDYLLGNLIGVSDNEAQRNTMRAKQLSLSLLYWLQTEAPRPDGKTGWPGLRLRKDLVDTEDGLAKYPYIRESRRIKAEFTVLEHHVGKEGRAQHLGKPAGSVTAEVFPDSVGIGYYRIDLHPTTGGDNYIDVDSLPFQIPLGALIPKRIENVLTACKNIGTTHITNGCYRLHPVEWGIGEAAGACAAFALAASTTPRAVRNTPKLMNGFQSALTQQGVRLAWAEGAKLT